MNRNRPEPISPTQFILLLHSVPHIGEKTLTRLLRQVVQQRLNPDAFLALDPEEWRRRFELRPQSIAHLQSHREALLAQSAELAREIRAHSLRVLTISDATYPAQIERNDDAPPPILYTFGNQSLLEVETAEMHPGFTFVVAASNEAPPESLDRLDALAGALALAGGIAVTGHDRPAYQRVALAAQRQDRPILYVFDRGLREALGPQFDRPPFAAARIREALFDPLMDLAVSPFRLDAHGLAGNLRRRDRLIFALADLLVAGDIRAGGGMFEECRKAHAQGRPVYVAAGGRDGNEALRALGCPPLPTTADWAQQLAAGG